MQGEGERLAEGRVSTISDGTVRRAADVRPREFLPAEEAGRLQ